MLSGLISPPVLQLSSLGTGSAAIPVTKASPTHLSSKGAGHSTKWNVATTEGQAQSSHYRDPGHSFPEYYQQQRRREDIKVSLPCLANNPVEKKYGQHSCTHVIGTSSHAIDTFKASSIMLSR